MKLSRARMLERAQARDAAFDGIFLTGVTSTGIYCLPSCPARPPKPENVVHFKTPKDARTAGLRGCLRCRPDDFYKGYDPDEDLAATLAREVVAEPAKFADVSALVARAGVRTTKLHAIFREHFHSTPAAFLARARVALACARLRGGRRVLDASLDAGFESSSAFYANFAPRVGMAPDAYRRLGRAASFTLTLPEGFRTDEWLAYVGRDQAGPCERVDGAHVYKAVELEGEGAVLHFELRGGEARCKVEGGPPTPARTFAAHALAVASLNLDAEPASFEARAGKLQKLVRRRPGLRVPRTFDPFEALVWTVAGQQVNVTFATTLRRRVIEAIGTKVGDMRAHPTPSQVAAIAPADLRARQFSTRKAEYLIDAAAAMARGDLVLTPCLDEPAPRVRRRILAQRGFGAWSASYVLMRGYGFADCAPAGDVGLQAALQRAFALDERPDEAATGELMTPFAPYRSYATYHLWCSLGDPA